MSMDMNTDTDKDNKEITGTAWLINRGRQRYSKNVKSLYIIAFGLFSELNFKSDNDSNIPKEVTNNSDNSSDVPKAITQRSDNATNFPVAITAQSGNGYTYGQSDKDTKR